MKKKTLIMLLCGVLLIGGTAFGTIAYLTATAGVVNRFTVGNVTIDLDETAVLPDGSTVDADGDGVPDRTAPDASGQEGNRYHLLPGQTYVKDPTVTVGATSESSYVRLLVTVNCAAELDALCRQLHAAYPGQYLHGLPQDHVAGYDASTWVYQTSTPNAAANAVTYEFRYHDVVKPDGTNDLVLDALFDSFTVPPQLSVQQLATLNGLEIRVVAQAIQSTGFATADEAWAAFPVQP